MELFDGGADGGGTAKEHVADGFGLGGWRISNGKCGRESDLSKGDSGHESGFRKCMDKETQNSRFLSHPVLRFFGQLQNGEAKRYATLSHRDCLRISGGQPSVWCLEHLPMALSHVEF